MGAAPGEDEFSTASYIAVGLRCGLSVQETLQQPVGLVQDLWEIYKRSHGMTDKYEE